MFININVLSFIVVFFLTQVCADQIISWPSTQVVKVRVAAHAPNTRLSPSEKLHRRGPSGIVIVSNPVFIDMKLDVSDASGIDLDQLDLCFQLYDVTKNVEVENICKLLKTVKDPPIYPQLNDGHHFFLKAWLRQNDLNSIVSIIDFEVGVVQNLLPQHTEGMRPKWHSTVPYDPVLVSKVGKCVDEKSKQYLLEHPNEDTVSLPLFAETVYHHMDSGFLGAPVRKVLNAKQLHDVGSLVSCAQSVKREDGVVYDGAVARDDFGKFHDESYEPHMLVNLNPFINGGLLPDVKERIYEAVHQAAVQGKSKHTVYSIEERNNTEQAFEQKDQMKKNYHLGFRVMEHLSYPIGVGLEAHEDEDSSLTVSILVSDASEYEGGKFYLMGNEVTEDFHPGDGLVFESMSAHRVSPVTSGTRKVLVVELWPFPDGVIPSRVAIPQRYPPPLEEIVTTVKTSLTQGNKPSRRCDNGVGGGGGGEENDQEECVKVIEEEENEVVDSENTAEILQSYIVLKGGLVATGALPYYNHQMHQGIDGNMAISNPSSPQFFTWKEAVQACDAMLTCLSFTYLHPTPLVGNEAESTTKVYVEFKREASPIRIKGSMDVSEGTYGAVSTANGIPRWTAVKPFPIKTLLNEWIRENAMHQPETTSSSLSNYSSYFTSNYRECEEWALDGHCEKLKYFMQEECSFFCRAIRW